MDYTIYFVDGLNSDEIARRIGVCHKTIWFLRLRTIQAVFPNPPSFQIKAGNDVKIHRSISVKVSGMRFDGMENAPREPRKDVGGGKHEINDVKICVITGLNDIGDLFFGICRRDP